MKKLFIFDFDGTLFNTLDQFAYNMNQALKVHNFPQLTISEYKNVVGGNLEEVISKILGKNSTSENNRKVKESYLKNIEINEDNLTRPFYGINEILKYLQENNTLLAINSNRYTYSIKEYVNKFFNNINFIDIQGHNPPNPSKPDAYGVFEIIKKTSLKKDEILYIGDSVTDVQTAENAGIDCILVDWGYEDSNNLSKANVLKIIHNPFELQEFIEK